MEHIELRVLQPTMSPSKMVVGDVLTGKYFILIYSLGFYITTCIVVIVFSYEWLHAFWSYLTFSPRNVFDS